VARKERRGQEKRRGEEGHPFFGLDSSDQGRYERRGEGGKGGRDPYLVQVRERKKRKKQFTGKKKRTRRGKKKDERLAWPLLPRKEAMDNTRRRGEEREEKKKEINASKSARTAGECGSRSARL